MLKTIAEVHGIPPYPSPVDKSFDKYQSLVIGQYPNSHHLKMLAAEIYASKGDNLKAIALHNEIDEHLPDAPQNIYKLGVSQRAIGDHEAALVSFSRASRAVSDRPLS